MESDLAGRRTLDDVTGGDGERVGRVPRAFVLGLLGLLAGLAPLLTDGAAPAAVALAVALAAVLVVEHRLGHVGPVPCRAAPTTAYDAWPTLRARVTAPDRHPLRPRAPGAR